MTTNDNTPLGFFYIKYTRAVLLRAYYTVYIVLDNMGIHRGSHGFRIVHVGNQPLCVHVTDKYRRYDILYAIHVRV